MVKFMQSIGRKVFVPKIFLEMGSRSMSALVGEQCTLQASTANFWIRYEVRTKDCSFCGNALNISKHARIEKYIEHVLAFFNFFDHVNDIA